MRQAVMSAAGNDRGSGRAPAPRLVCSVLALAMLAGIGLGGAGMARAAVPVVLTDVQMDAVNAGSSTVLLDLVANAVGPVTTAITTGSVTNEPAQIMEVAFDPRGRLLGHTVGPVPVELFFASGQAVASGANLATCSAGTAFEGDFLATLQAGTMVATPTEAICNCAAFAVAPLR